MPLGSSRRGSISVRARLYLRVVIDIRRLSAVTGSHSLRFVVSVFALSAACGWCVVQLAPSGAQAASGLLNFVYVNENPNGANMIAAFGVAPGGGMTDIGTYSTGGTGNAGSFVAAERAGCN